MGYIYTCTQVHNHVPVICELFHILLQTLKSKLNFLLKSLLTTPAGSSDGSSAESCTDGCVTVTSTSPSWIPPFAAAASLSVVLPRTQHGKRSPRSRVNFASVVYEMKVSRARARRIQSCWVTSMTSAVKKPTTNPAASQMRLAENPASCLSLKRIPVNPIGWRWSDVNICTLELLITNVINSSNASNSRQQKGSSQRQLIGVQVKSQHAKNLI